VFIPERSHSGTTVSILGIIPGEWLCYNSIYRLKLPWLKKRPIVCVAHPTHVCSTSSVCFDDRLCFSKPWHLYPPALAESIMAAPSDAFFLFPLKTVRRFKVDSWADYSLRETSYAFSTPTTISKVKSTWDVFPMNFSLSKWSFSSRPVQPI
jgi:hypothetical protein